MSGALEKLSECCGVALPLTRPVFAPRVIAPSVPAPKHGEPAGARPITPVEADILTTFLSTRADELRQHLVDVWDIAPESVTEVVATLRAKLAGITAQALRSYP